MALQGGRKFEDIVREEEVIQGAAMPLAEVPTCMKLFDALLSCYALIPQTTSIYRYGTFRDCSSKMDDFKYCLSLKAESDEERKRLWIRRRAEQMARKRLEGSSEDVWEMRRDPLISQPPGS